MPYIHLISVLKYKINSSELRNTHGFRDPSKELGRNNVINLPWGVLTPPGTYSKHFVFVQSLDSIRIIVVFPKLRQKGSTAQELLQETLTKARTYKGGTELPGDLWFFFLTHLTWCLPSLRTTNPRMGLLHRAAGFQVLRLPPEARPMHSLTDRGKEENALSSPWAVFLRTQRNRKKICKRNQIEITFRWMITSVGEL